MFCLWSELGLYGTGVHVCVCVPLSTCVPSYCMEERPLSSPAHMGTVIGPRSSPPFIGGLLSHAFVLSLCVRGKWDLPARVVAMVSKVTTAAASFPIHYSGCRFQALQCSPLHSRAQAHERVCTQHGADLLPARQGHQRREGQLPRPQVHEAHRE